jgi:hypothetical protein
MGSDFKFGGGAAQSSMTPVVLAATLVVGILVLVLPRRYAIVPILIAMFLTPFGQQVLAGGFHLFVSRLLILAGGLRVLKMRISGRGPLLPGGPTRLDATFCLWALSSAAAFILLYRAGAAVANQMGFLLDALGGYFLFRILVKDEGDVCRVAKALAAVASILAVCMGYEYLTRINAFSALNGAPIVPWIREGRVRAQGVFANSITAGSFGATLLPLFYWLWKSGRARVWGAFGLLGSTIVALSSVAGTAALSFLAAILGLCLWPIRKLMRPVRWGIVLTVMGLALVMKAPVWFVIARFAIVGGAHAWDRAALIDAFVRHFPDWWLLGAKDNAAWGADTWDACNQYVAAGSSGGLAGLMLFLLILARGFSTIGDGRKAVEGDRQSEWFFWSLGVLLFAHVITFWGIDYFDQTQVWWYLTLAIIAAATAPYLSPKAQPERNEGAEYAGVAWGVTSGEGEWQVTSGK